MKYNPGLKWVNVQNFVYFRCHKVVVVNFKIRLTREYSKRYQLNSIDLVRSLERVEIKICQKLKLRASLFYFFLFDGSILHKF